MKEITITIDGVEYIARPKNETVTAEKPKTGYERSGSLYFFNDDIGKIGNWCKERDDSYKEYYSIGNYYNDETLAKNNARADTLTRKLRQWQALNDEPVDWSGNHIKFYIFYDYEENTFKIGHTFFVRCTGQLYFSSAEKAWEAIEVFKNDLTWYFTEYQQRLDEPNIIN